MVVKILVVVHDTELERCRKGYASKLYRFPGKHERERTNTNRWADTRRLFLGLVGWQQTELALALIALGNHRHLEVEARAARWDRH